MCDDVTETGVGKNALHNKWRYINDTIKKIVYNRINTLSLQ